MSDDLDQFRGVDFPAPLPQGQRPNIPQIRSAPVQTQQPQQGYTPGEGQEVGGLINFFKSLFHRQTDLDNIMDQNGLRQPVQPLPPPSGVRG